eukprot:484734-Pelagomonas_calceolata.AAC.1
MARLVEVSCARIAQNGHGAFVQGMGKIVPPTFRRIVWRVVLAPWNLEMAVLNAHEAAWLNLCCSLPLNYLSYCGVPDVRGKCMVPWSKGEVSVC